MTEAWRSTKEKQFCLWCKKYVRTVLVINGEKFCYSTAKPCFIQGMKLGFIDNDVLRIYALTDELFEIRKEFVLRERNKITPKIRFTILERDGFKCVACGVSAQEAKLQVDHIKPVSKGGTFLDSNLQTLCWKCNAGKGAKWL